MSSPQMVADPYHSRGVAKWEAAERCDPVVYGDAGPLSSDELEQYAANGFHSSQSLITPEEAGELLQEAERLAAEADVTRDDVIAEPDSHMVRSVFRIHRTNDQVRELVKDPRLADIARQMLGGDVYVHQSRINFKLPFSGKEFFWHSDFETWHVEDGMPRMRAVSLSLNLSENTEFNGPLMLVRGSHQYFIRCAGETPDDHFAKSLRKQEYGVPSCDALEFLVRRGEIMAPKGLPGSGTFFDCNTMHGSVSNLSPYPRINLFVVFNSVENTIQDPFGGQPPRPEFLAERDVVPVSEL